MLLFYLSTVFNLKQFLLAGYPMQPYYQDYFNPSTFNEAWFYLFLFLILILIFSFSRIFFPLFSPHPLCPLFGRIFTSEQLFFFWWVRAELPFPFSSWRSFCRILGLTTRPLWFFSQQTKPFLEIIRQKKVVTHQNESSILRGSTNTWNLRGR